MIPFKPAEDLFALLAPAAALLVALVAAAALLIWYARRHGGFVRFAAAGRTRRRLRVLERLALSRQASLVLVEYDGRALLLGQSGERVSLLHGLEGDTAMPADAPSATDHAA